MKSIQHKNQSAGTAQALLFVLAFSSSMLLLGIVPVSGNDANCWSTGLDYEFCCEPEKGLNYKLHGNPTCWDAMFTYPRCCLTFAMSDEDSYMYELNKK